MNSKQFKNYSRVLEDALKIINNNKYKNFRSGRTDSGAYSSPSCSFDFDFKEKSKFDLKNAINSNLPRKSELQIAKSSIKFSSRFSALEVDPMYIN